MPNLTADPTDPFTAPVLADATLADLTAQWQRLWRGNEVIAAALNAERTPAPKDDKAPRDRGAWLLSLIGELPRWRALIRTHLPLVFIRGAQSPSPPR